MEAIRIKAKVYKEDIIYVDSLLDCYGDFAVARTIDPQEGLIEFIVSPSFISETKELLESLKKEINLLIIEKI